MKHAPDAGSTTRPDKHHSVQPLFCAVRQNPSDLILNLGTISQKHLGGSVAPELVYVVLVIKGAPELQ